MDRTRPSQARAWPCLRAVRPAPLTEEETAQRVAKDRRTPAADRPALDGPLTLLGAMARSAGSQR